MYIGVFRRLKLRFILLRNFVDSSSKLSSSWLANTPIKLCFLKSTAKKLTGFFAYAYQCYQQECDHFCDMALPYIHLLVMCLILPGYFSLFTFSAKLVQLKKLQVPGSRFTQHWN